MKKSNRRLFFSFIDDLYSTDDARKVCNAVRQSENKEILDEVAMQVWEESSCRTVLTGFEFERYKDEGYSLLNRIGGRRKMRYRRFSKVLFCALALFFLILGSIAYWNYINVKPPIYQEIVTSYGETKEIVLADGTVLVLNSCSKVRFPDCFVEDERRIELEGEGYFQVSRNERRPFIVKTSRFEVRVLGTSFNVKSYEMDELVSVEVESGKVQVDTPEAMMRLSANERILINTVTGNYKKSDDTDEVAQWRNGTLCFQETPIRDVAKELERIYHCTITFASGQDFDNLISGEHDNASLESVLFSIEYTSGIHYRKEGNRVWMYK